MRCNGMPCEDGDGGILFNTGLFEQIFDNDCVVGLSMRLSRLPRLIERYEKLAIASKGDLKIEKDE